MWGKIWAGQFAGTGSLTNLEDLRDQLTGRLALLLVGGSCLALWSTLPLNPYPFTVLKLLVGLLGLGFVVRMLVKERPVLARHVLVWGSAAGLLLGMWLLFDPWLPFLGLLLIFVAAVLISGGELAVAGLVAVAATWLAREGSRAYPLPGLFIGLVLAVTLAWLVVWTLYTALQWAWSMQQRADGLLDEVRDRQAELSRILKASELANILLRRTQHELIQARKQADEARRMKEQFAANISHELRTPLNLILGFSELMYLWPDVYGEMQWPPNLRRATYQIYRSSRHLLEMVNDILDLSRFEMAGFTLAKEPTALEPVLRETVEIMEDLFQGDVRLEVDIAPFLPVLEIDRTRIRQVLLNLLNNALRFTEAGRVQLEAKQVEDEVVISVSDTGPGIPADQLAHIFDEFYQVDTSLHRSHQGAGLGLAISKHFVQAHEGRIWVDSQEGAGSTFCFALPVPGHVSPLPLQPKELPEAQWPETNAPIVLVDPDPALAGLVSRYFEGYQVIQVDTVEQLEGVVTTYHPRAVISNAPPGEQGNYKDVLTAAVPFFECSLPNRSWVAKRLAIAACLTKPVTMAQLLAEIERLGDVQNVLIIDDDRGFSQLVSMTLQAAGRNFEVQHAYDGERGLQAMQLQQPDLVLLDYLMPGINGVCVLEKMRQNPNLADVPVILLTATNYIDEVLRQRCDRLVLQRLDGLLPGEALRCLRAVVEVLEPHYED